MQLSTFINKGGRVMTPEQMQQLQMNPAVGAGLGIGILITYLAVYVFFAFCLAKIGEKLGQPFGQAFLMSIIPIANLVFLLQLAGKPIWWIVLMLMPIVNIVIFALIWMEICKRRGRPAWQGILFFVPVANLVILLMLAFGK